MRLVRSFIRQIKVISTNCVHLPKRRMSSNVLVDTATSMIKKSPNDKRDYRFVVLDNGLRALLISDLDGAQEPEDDNDSDDMETDAESEGSEMEEEDGESEGEMSDAEDVDDTQASEKMSAAALCIGVGSFSDPDDIQGFAHFLEHMVFMGSEKYPKENAFDDYLSRHGGHTNAWTDHERTNFYFDVDRDYFRKSLDQFAQFFVNSLLLKDAVDREIQAVDSEFQERVPSDDDRLCQIMADTAKPGHPMSKFLLGNLESLKKMPEEKNIDVYGRLRDFYERYYTAQYMTLAVHSKHNLDKLEKWTRESFSGIRNNKEPPVTFYQMKEPFDTDAFRKIYKVIAVTTTHKLYVTWPFPPLQAKYRLKPLEYISSLMNHEGEGSIYSYLKKRNWAFGVLGGNSGDGNDMNTTWSGMDMCITLTDTGIKHVHEVLQVIFSYIRLLKDAGTQEWFYRELQLTEDNKFRWKEQGDPTEYVEKMADNMQLYPPRDFLTGHRLLFQYDSQVLSDCMDNLRADNCNVMILSSDLTEADCPHREGWFGSKYNMEDITPELRQQWTSELGATQAELYLPRPNQFLLSFVRATSSRYSGDNCTVI